VALGAPINSHVPQQPSSNTLKNRWAWPGPVIIHTIIRQLPSVGKMSQRFLSGENIVVIWKLVSNSIPSLELLYHK